MALFQTTDQDSRTMAPTTNTARTPEGKKDKQLPHKVTPNASHHFERSVHTRKHKKQTGSSKSQHTAGPYPNRVFTTGALNGFMLAYVKKPVKEEQAYLRPIDYHLKKHPSKYEEWGITEIMDRRAQDGTNYPMPAIPEKPRIGAFHQYVRIVPTDNDNTKEKREAWGRQLADAFNIIGSNVS